MKDVEWVYVRWRHGAPQELVRSLTSPQASYTLSRKRTTSSIFDTSVGTTMTLDSPTMAVISLPASARLDSSTSARTILRPNLTQHGQLSR